MPSASPPPSRSSLGTAAAPRSLAESDDPPARGPVVVASDGRAATNAVFRAARLLARRLGVAVEVVGVLEPLPTYLMHPELPIAPLDLEPERRAALASLLRQRLAEAGGGAERWPVRVVLGEVARTIATVARERDASAIVVGSGRHLVRDRLLGGEHALRVVRMADRPVLAVAPDFRDQPRTAVVAVDFSPASVRAARAALVGLPEGGRLVLVHVRPPIDPPLVAESGVAVARPELARLVERWAGEAVVAEATLFGRLRDELRPYAPRGVTLETRTHDGGVVEAVLQIADEVGAELVASGTHGPGLVERFFVGSVAADLLRTAGRTVLVAPAPNPAESARLRLRLRGTAELTKPEDWGVALDAFTRRNAGRRVRLEVDDPEIGAQLQVAGFALLGATYDRHDRRVELMLGDPASRTRHLTRTIPLAADLALYAGPDGRERALSVASGRGQTLLTFAD